jgi:HPt (histidine-containing phosphotransfer) domain-containing protein
MGLSRLPMEMAQQSALHEAMNRLWAQYLPQIEERVATLEAAGRSLMDGTLTAEQSERASAAAHNLAGVLGTFGLAEGTTLAREAEAFYCIGPPIEPTVNARMVEVAVRLRALIATRK